MTRRGGKQSRPSTKKAKSSAEKPGDWRSEDPNLEVESQRYENPIASRELLLKHLSEAPEPLTAERLAKRLGMRTDAERDALSKRLAAMVRDGQAAAGPKGFAVASEAERLAGLVRGRANGDVLVIPEDGSPALLLARADTASLMHGDRVEVRAVGTNDRGRRVARLIRRIAEAPKLVGGVWHSNGGLGRVEPEDPGHWYSVEIAPRASHGAKDGDNVIVEITRRPQGESPAHGRVVEILAGLRPSDVAARFAIVRHDLPQEFPEEVLRAANHFDPQVREADKVGREDLRDLPLVTIDGEDARDFDDAVYAERLKGGGWRLIVAIADVSHYVRVGTALDAEARARATSVYFPDRVIPMLPEHLSNHLCSLMPEVERLAFVCDMRVGKTGVPGRAHFYEAIIRSHARLTYDRAWRFLADPADRSDEALTPPVRTSLEQLYAVYGALRQAREARGALDFRGGEVKARIGEDGKIEGFYAVVRNDAHRLIEECMIAANVQAATALRLAKAKSLYRVHGQPEEKRVTELMKVMNALKIAANFSEQPTPREFRQLVERVAARPDAALLEGLVIRSLAQAVYQQTNIGHFGLALEEYAHFTSPIRRYPDLLVHRAIKAALVPGSASGHRYSTAELQALGAESSERERRADDASRDVMGYLKCLYMQPRVGEQFEGTVTSALEFGLFVQLKDMPIDGLVHISKLPGDYWEIDGGGTGLVGRRTGRRWRMGDAIQVRLSRVDLLQRQIDFEPVEGGSASGSGSEPEREPRLRRGPGAAARRSSRGGGRGRRGRRG
ncbi:MAG TPA: ribonuclease R [Steroidobacteraceae bacterium]|jgi:ribonuclease R|nr:ribonuclease R [Steroidobacteraceae bacterium]